MADAPHASIIGDMIDRLKVLTLPQFLLILAAAVVAIPLWSMAQNHQDLWMQLKSSPVWGASLAGCVVVLIVGALLATMGAKGEAQTREIMKILQEQLAEGKSDIATLRAEIATLRATNERQQGEIERLRDAEADCRRLVAELRAAPTRPGNL